MEKATQYRTEKFKTLKPRDISQAQEKANFVNRQSKSIAAAQQIVRKSAVDQYALKVPYNSI